LFKPTAQPRKVMNKGSLLLKEINKKVSGKRRDHQHPYQK